MRYLLNAESVTNFTKGKSNGYDEIFKAYYPALVPFANKLINDWQEAEDITSIVFAKLWEMHTGFNTEENIKAFLYISTRNACLNFLDAKKRKEGILRNLPADDDFDTETRNCYLESDILSLLYNEIEKLPEHCKAVFKLIYIEELKTTEIADRLRISPGTVYTQKKRALKLLRLRLSEYNLPKVLVFLMLLELGMETFSKKSAQPFADLDTHICFYN